VQVIENRHVDDEVFTVEDKAKVSLGTEVEEVILEVHPN
jgi:hypothetical protein